MCGICGYMGSGDMATLQAMNQAMLHRGPDSGGLWLHPDRPVGLAMRRLSIVDLETGDQPIFNEDGSIVLVFNGEIYNYQELRESLRARGHRFKTGSDTEVIVHGYEEYGRELLTRLRGMFAFALWDEPGQCLFLGRDRLGIKPLYYVENGGRLQFASEQKPLLVGGLAKAEVNFSSVIRNLMLGFYTGPQSIFSGIQQLPAGHGMLWSAHGSEVFSYWALPEINGDDAAPVKGEDLLQAVAGCVDSHLIGDVPVGLTLSGGLDSSILARFMAQRLGERLEPYTLGFGAASDETPFAREVTASFGLKLRERLCTPEQALASLPAMVWHLEEPLSNITAITAYHWARFVGQQMKVTLIGEGADELFGGYLQYLYYKRLSGVLPFKARAALFSALTLQPRPGFIKKLLAPLPNAAQEVRHIYHSEYLNAFSQEPGLRPVLRFDIEHQLTQNQLLRIDRMTMAHSLEARVPYLDHKLVELAWAMPDIVKISGSSQKHLLRQACRGLLPESVINRPKTGTGGSQGLFPVLFPAGLESLIKHALKGGQPPLDRFCPRTLDKLVNGRALKYPLMGQRIRDKLVWSLFLLVLWWELFINRDIRCTADIPGLKDIWPSWEGPAERPGGYQ